MPVYWSEFNRQNMLRFKELEREVTVPCSHSTLKLRLVPWHSSEPEPSYRYSPLVGSVSSRLSAFLTSSTAIRRVLKTPIHLV